MTAVKKPKKTKKSLHPLHPRRVKRTVSRHYFSFMPNKKHHRVLVWVVFLITSFIVAAQLLYPPDRALPLARINDTKVGWTSDDHLAKMLNDRFNSTKIRLTIGSDRSREYDLKVAGAEPNTQAMIARLSGYPLWVRYIPFSIFWQPAQVNTVDITYSDAVLTEFSESSSRALSFAPVNARLAVQDDKLVATDDVQGSTVTPVVLMNVLKKTPLKLGGITTITVPSDRRKAAMTMQDFTAVKVKAEVALGRTITISAGSQVFTPPRATIASWLLIGTNDKEKATLSVDPARLAIYLDEINAKVGTPASRTNITIVNGRETGRTPGTPGRGINRDVLSAQLTEVLTTNTNRTTPTLVAQFVDVQPGIIYNNKYTATQEGLQAYVDDVSRTRNVRISIQQLDGGRWTANARATESTPSASTFKLFVSLMLFDKMQKGEIRWSDSMLDTTVAGCFNRMTIASTNPCAYKWLDMWGRGNVNTFVHTHSFSNGTVFSSSEATRTTAADLTQFMIGLNSGTLVKEPYRSQLLRNLFIHPYQDGIPRGSAGIVHNKVGFLWDYVHDTAIVQHPKGTYVMTVMTKGQSYAAIANITREVERIMYP